MWRHPAHVIALGLGSGLSPWAPGTVGSLWAWLAFVVIDPWLTDPGWAMLLLLSFGLGVWACSRTGRALGVSDHGGMVWDEVVAMWLVLWLTPVAASAGATLAWQAGAFALFRFFDIVKPPPIRYFDARLKGGFGVMWDDIVAAFYSLLCLAAVKAWGV